jgi:hypothetical protein
MGKPNHNNTYRTMSGPAEPLSVVQNTNGPISRLTPVGTTFNPGHLAQNVARPMSGSDGSMSARFKRIHSSNFRLEYSYAFVVSEEEFFSI